MLVVELRTPERVKIVVVKRSVKVRPQLLHMNVGLASGDEDR